MVWFIRSNAMEFIAKKKLKKITISKTLLAQIVTIIMWSSAFVAIRFGVKEYHPGSFALLRLSVGAMCMTVIYYFNQPRQTIAKKDIVYAMCLGLIGMSVYQTSLNYGEITVGAGVASFIIAQVPIITTILAIIFLKEKITKFGWLGLLISFIGVVLISIGELEHTKFDMGVIYILIATISASIYITNAKPLLARMNSIHLTVYVAIGGAIGTLIFTPQLLQDITTASTGATLSAIYLGIFPTALAYLTYNYALSKTPASTAASWLYTLPFVTSFMGWLFLVELPTLIAFIGGLIALFGTVLINIQKK